MKRSLAFGVASKIHYPQGKPKKKEEGEEDHEGVLGKT